MGWSSAVRKPTAKTVVTPQIVVPKIVPKIETAKIDWDRLVSLDFETFYDVHYTLKKMSTSEYVRDTRFEASMVGIKIGRRKTKLVPHNRIATELKAINWETHSVLCHNVQFDGFILSHHYGVIPKHYYCTLSMARGLHSNEIGAGLDDVSVFYGGQGKLEGLEDMKGLRFKELFANKPLWNKSSLYCCNDVDEMHRVFTEMVKTYPAKEIDLIHMTARMFCAPALRVDIPRVQAEYEREVRERKELTLSVLDPREYDSRETLKTKAERELQGEERDMLIVKRVVGSNEKFKELLLGAGVREPDIPVKLSPAWMKKSSSERTDEGKWTYAFAKDDLDFINLPDRVWELYPDLNPNDPGHIIKASARQVRLQHLVDTRLSVKSTTNITRAERFLEAGRDGMKLPVGYRYYGAVTGRWAGNNKMNMQNLTRGGELRLSILADKGHQIAVADSGQIEARVNGWLWGQDDLLEAFRVSDAYNKEVEGIPKDKRRPMREDERDAYCRFADDVYGRTIWKADETERFVGKVCLAEDTLVVTDRGLVPIVLVRPTDFLWDGDRWVKHDGLVDQGIKEVISCKGLRATADHEILTERGWQEWSAVHTDPFLFRSALSLANSPLFAGGTTPPPKASRGGIARYVSALAGWRPWSIRTTFEVDGQRAATHVQRSQPVPSATGPTKMPWLTTSIGRGFSIASLRQSLGAATQAMLRTSTMACGEFVSRIFGGMTERPSFGMFKLCQAGTTPNWRWTGSKPTGGMNRGIFGSPQSPTTSRTSAASKTSNSAFASSKQRTRTYDLANAGPSQRFAVMTDDGLIIVHNCVLGLGYQMGAPKFQMTLAKGALGGPKMNFPIDQCQHIVNTYRRKNYRIAQGWCVCKTIIEDMAAGIPGEHKCLSWGGDGQGGGWILLPNGMKLKYPDLRKVQNDKGWDEWSYQSGDMRKKIYGGLLCENLVQALARIIVAEQMLMIDVKYPVVMTTHDECATHPKTTQAAKCFDFMQKCMSTPLWWCPDLPVISEGGFDIRYSK